MAAPALGYFPQGYFAGYWPAGYWPAWGEDVPAHGVATVTFTARAASISLEASAPGMTFTARKPEIVFNEE